MNMVTCMSMLLLTAAVIPADLPTFQRDVSPAILAARPCDAKHWRQIEPAVHHLALEHAGPRAGQRVGPAVQLGISPAA